MVLWIKQHPWNDAIGFHLLEAGYLDEIHATQQRVFRFVLCLSLFF